ncbi:MAG: hypothetical protein ISQ85_06885 [Planktomarina sp.]|nr:hypothetical protein [Planktomarina sp.]
MPGFFGVNNSKSLFSNDTMNKNKCNNNNLRRKRKNKIVKKKNDINNNIKPIKEETKPNFKSFINTFKGLKNDMDDLFERNNESNKINKSNTNNILKKKNIVNTMYENYINEIKSNISTDSENNNNIFQKRTSNKRIDGNLLTLHKYINKADYDVVFNDNPNTLVQEILVDDKLKINNTILVSENAIDEVNDEISKVLVKIDKNLTVTNEEVLELKKKVYTLLEIEEEPLIVSLDDILPIQ